MTTAMQVKEALEQIASLAITPDTGYSVAQAMRRIAEEALTARSPEAEQADPVRDALDWLINCIECEVNVKGTTSFFQLRLAKAKAALASTLTRPDRK